MSDIYRSVFTDIDDGSVVTMPAAVRHPPLVTQVSDQVRALVESGEWPVGAKIPGEHELAQRFDVSRATVREALRGLSITGLLEPRAGDGTYVRASNEITGLLARDDVTSMLDHVLETRAGLEAASARLAAERATTASVRSLKQGLRARDNARRAGDVAGFARADYEFHRSVIVASGNPLLLRLHDAVAEILAASIEHTAVLPEDDAVGHSHADVVHAIEARDPDAAVAAAYHLIEAVRSAAPAD